MVGVLVEVSVKVTVNGAVPDTGVPVKPATGFTGRCGNRDIFRAGDGVASCSILGSQCNRVGTGAV